MADQPVSGDEGTGDPASTDDPTVGQVEEATNRHIWMVMYVFIGLVILVFAVVGFGAVTGQLGN